MLIVVSPAKKLDFESTPPTNKYTQLKIKNLDKAESLIEELKKCKPSEISKLMKLSDSLTQLNVKRYKAFNRPFSKDNAKQALFAFKGDTYVGLDPESMSADKINYAQEHLRILSGLYGMIAPLDLVQPYRLEMGTKFPCDGAKNLYEYWSDTVTKDLNKLLDKEEVLINLASKEYFSVINFKKLNHTVITPVFKEKKGDEYKIVSFFAKKARGMMSRYIIDHKVSDPKDLLAFDTDGYKFNKKLSTPNEPTFTRT